jgi:hypothetical protein
MGKPDEALTAFGESVRRIALQRRIALLGDVPAMCLLLFTTDPGAETIRRRHRS